MPKLPAGLRHTIWSLADTVSYPVIYFACVPLLIRYLGQAGFGFWMVLTTFMVVLQLFNLSSGYTAVKHIAHARASDDPAAVPDVINGLLRITLYQFGGCLIIGAVAALLIYYTGWLSDENLRHMPLCWGLAALMAGLRFVEQVLQHIVKAFERFRAAAMLNIFYRCSSLLLTLVLAAGIGAQIHLLLIANILFLLVYSIGHYRYLRRLLPAFRFARPRADDLMQRLAGYGVWPWIQTIVIVACFQADRFWVSAYSGLAEVSAYGLVATMINHINIIFTAMVGWASPRIVGIHARGESPATEYHFIRSLLTLISIASLLLFYFISPLIFPLWVGAEEYARMAPYIRGFTGFEIAFVQTIMPFFYLNGTGHERSATYATILCCGSCFVLMLVGLIGFHSPAAMVQGMTIGVCLTVPVYNAIANKQLAAGARPQSIISDMLPVLAAIGILYSASLLLSLGLVLLGGWALGRYYFTNIRQAAVWKQVLGPERPSL
jgi:O-antigen/teichoic acid export membrane protein